jgi:hypothetical protein
METLTNQMEIASKLYHQFGRLIQKRPVDMKLANAKFDGMCEIACLLFGGTPFRIADDIRAAIDECNELIGRRPELYLAGDNEPVRHWDHLCIMRIAEKFA